MDKILLLNVVNMVPSMVSCIENSGDQGANAHLAMGTDWASGISKTSP